MLADRWDRIHDRIGKPGIPSKVEGRLNKEGPDALFVGAFLIESSFHLRLDTRLAYTVVYPIPAVCQHAQPSTPNAEGNPRNQPEISVRRSTAKIADRYSKAQSQFPGNRVEALIALVQCQSCDRRDRNN